VRDVLHRKLHRDPGRHFQDNWWQRDRKWRSEGYGDPCQIWPHGIHRDIRSFVTETFSIRLRPVQLQPRRRCETRRQGPVETAGHAWRPDPLGTPVHTQVVSANVDL
jgi:hypothetical protein